MQINNYGGSITRFKFVLAFIVLAVLLMPGLGQNAEAWLDVGNTLYDQGKHLDAFLAYAKAWYNRGNALRNLGRYDEALNSYNMALDLNPGYIKAWKDKGNVLYAQGEYEEAIRAYDQVLELDPNHKEAMNKRRMALEQLECDEKSGNAFVRTRGAWRNG